jgi:hypothetical protein
VLRLVGPQVVYLVSTGSTIVFGCGSPYSSCSTGAPSWSSGPESSFDSLSES